MGVDPDGGRRPSVGRVFLSHAGHDRALTDALVKLLVDGTALSTTDIFYSSDPLTGVPIGQNFPDYIAQRLNSTCLVIQVITSAYLGSAFCMSELGAVWVSRTPDFPIVIAPLVPGDLPGPIRNIQASRLDAEQMADAGVTLDLLLESLVATCSVAVRVPEWNRARNSFLDALPQLLARIAGEQSSGGPHSAGGSGDEEPQHSARRVLRGMTSDDRATHLVYSSHSAWALFDQAGRPIRLAEGRIPVTTVRDAQGLARIQALLNRVGKTKGLSSLAPDDFSPDHWSADLVLLGSRRANLLAHTLLTDQRCPFQFDRDDSSIVDAESGKLLERRTLDYDYGILAKWHAADATYVVAAGIGSHGTRACCDFLVNEIETARVADYSSSFACIVRVSLHDERQHPQRMGIQDWT